MARHAIRDYNIGQILVPHRAAIVGKNIKSTFASPPRFAISRKKK